MLSCLFLQVTVLGGTTLEELSEWLEHRGLALSVLPAILGQTIAGAISTGMGLPWTIPEAGC